MTWEDRFDCLLGAMVKGEPHKAQKQSKPNEEQRPEPVKKP